MQRVYPAVTYSTNSNKQSLDSSELQGVDSAVTCSTDGNDQSLDQQ